MPDDLPTEPAPRDSTSRPHGAVLLLVAFLAVTAALWAAVLFLLVRQGGL